MKSWKDNIFFILIEPKEPGNIGASARAMKNMGFKNLELVKPGDFLSNEARQMACDSVDILERARVHSRFRDAIEDKNLVIGTTRRLGKTRGLIIPLEDSVKKIITSAKKNRIVILFGREKNGLTNKEVEKCGFLITIPDDPSSPSINLAQSVMLVAYELSKKTYRKDTPALVTHEEIEKLYKHIQTTLKLLEYIPRGDRDIDTRIIRNLKHLIGRAGLTEWELNMLHGICSQVEKKFKV
jgi:TrmH family RNA methyltransferase